MYECVCVCLTVCVFRLCVLSVCAHMLVCVAVCTAGVPNLWTEDWYLLSHQWQP